MAWFTAAIPYISAAATAYGAYATYSQMQDAKNAKLNTPAPTVSDPTEMPSADALAARRSSVAELLRRRGRASTILTDKGQELLGAT